MFFFFVARWRIGKVGRADISKLRNARENNHK